MKSSKKSKTISRPQAQKEQRPAETGISGRGKKVILAGVVVLILGYLVLTRTDPAGQNWASKLSPFLILGGYALIGVGIIVPDKETTTPVS